MKSILKIISFFTFLYFINYGYVVAAKIEFLSDLDEHRGVLKKAFETAEDSIIIVSPYLSHNALEADDISPLIEKAQERGVKITVYTDCNFDVDQKTKFLKPHAEAGRNILQDLLCDLRVVKKVHAKTLIVDDTWMATGSFNWLSASRKQYWANLEHSMVITPHEDDASDTATYIKKAKDSINNLEKVKNPYTKFYDKYIDGVFSMTSSEDLAIWISDHLGNFSQNDQIYFSNKVVEFQRTFAPGSSDAEEDQESSPSQKTGSDEKNSSENSEDLSPITPKANKSSSTEEKKFIKELRGILISTINSIYTDFSEHEEVSEEDELSSSSLSAGEKAKKTPAVKPSVNNAKVPHKQPTIPPAKDIKKDQDVSSSPPAAKKPTPPKKPHEVVQSKPVPLTKTGPKPTSSSANEKKDTGSSEKAKGLRKGAAQKDKR